MRKKVTKTCKQCGKDFETREKVQVFCSKNCSATFNNKGRIPSLEQRKKVSEKLKGIKRAIKPIVLKKCIKCGKEFKPSKKNRKYCSFDCFLDHKGRRSIKNGGTISYRTLMKILKRAFPNWKCPFCDWTLTFATHHINGRNDGHIKSLVMLCPSHHTAVHKGYIKKEDLYPFAIGNMYTKEELLNKFYNGKDKNKEINFYHYNTEKTKKASAERSKQKIMF